MVLSSVTLRISSACLSDTSSAVDQEGPKRTCNLLGIEMGCYADCLDTTYTINGTNTTGKAHVQQLYDTAMAIDHVSCDGLEGKSKYGLE